MDSSGLAAGAAITILITLTLLAVGKFGQESHSDLEAALRLLYRNESPKKPRKSFFLFLSPVGAESGLLSLRLRVAPACPVEKATLWVISHVG